MATQVLTFPGVGSMAAGSFGGEGGGGGGGDERRSAPKGLHEMEGDGDIDYGDVEGEDNEGDGEPSKPASKHRKKRRSVEGKRDNQNKKLKHTPAQRRRLKARARARARARATAAQLATADEGSSTAPREAATDVAERSMEVDADDANGAAGCGAADLPSGHPAGLAAVRASEDATHDDLMVEASASPGGGLDEDSPDGGLDVGHEVSPDGGSDVQREMSLNRSSEVHQPTSDSDVGGLLNNTATGNLPMAISARGEGGGGGGDSGDDGSDDGVDVAGPSSDGEESLMSQAHTEESSMQEESEGEEEVEEFDPDDDQDTREALAAFDALSEHDQTQPMKKLRESERWPFRRRVGWKVGRDKFESALSRTSNVVPIVIQLKGTKHTGRRRCHNCAKGFKNRPGHPMWFKDCVSFPAAPLGEEDTKNERVRKGACANCAMGNHGTSCSLHEESRSGRIPHVRNEAKPFVASLLARGTVIVSSKHRLGTKAACEAVIQDLKNTVRFFRRRILCLEKQQAVSPMTSVDGSGE